MKTSAVTTADLARSVLSVPPLARLGDLTLNADANRALIRHLEAGGVSTMMYGGNANFYNVGLYEYAALLDFLEQTVAPDTWVIPSAGPDFGKLMDQARVLRTRAFPTAMVLPQTFPATPDGSERAIRLFAESYGRPVIVYLKAENFLTPAHVARLATAGLVAAVKYAVVRDDPADDPFLRELLDRVDAKLVISGIGERPAIVHLQKFGLPDSRRARFASRRAVRCACCRRCRRATWQPRRKFVTLICRSRIFAMRIRRSACCMKR